MSLAPLPVLTHVALSCFPRCPSFISMELNDPATFNSLPPEMLDCMAQAVKWCAKERSVHAVIYSGRCRGSDKRKHALCSGMAMSRDTLEKALSNEAGASVKKADKATVVKSQTKFMNALTDFMNALIDFPKIL